MCYHVGSVGNPIYCTFLREVPHWCLPANQVGMEFEMKSSSVTAVTLVCSIIVIAILITEVRGAAGIAASGLNPGLQSFAQAILAFMTMSSLGISVIATIRLFNWMGED